MLTVGSAGSNGQKGEKGETGSPGRDATNPGSVGTTYVHWGRTSCSSTSDLVYEGKTPFVITRIH